MRYSLVTLCVVALVLSLRAAGSSDIKDYDDGNHASQSDHHDKAEPRWEQKVEHLIERLEVLEEDDLREDLEHEKERNHHHHEEEEERDEARRHRHREEEEEEEEERRHHRHEEEEEKEEEEEERLHHRREEEEEEEEEKRHRRHEREEEEEEREHEEEEEREHEEEEEHEHRRRRHHRRHGHRKGHRKSHRKGHRKSRKGHRKGHRKGKKCNAVFKRWRADLERELHQALAMCIPGEPHRAYHGLGLCLPRNATTAHCADEAIVSLVSSPNCGAERVCCARVKKCGCDKHGKKHGAKHRGNGHGHGGAHGNGGRHGGGHGGRRGHHHGSNHTGSGHPTQPLIAGGYGSNYQSASTTSNSSPAQGLTPLEIGLIGAAVGVVVIGGIFAVVIAVKLHRAKKAAAANA